MKMSLKNLILGVAILGLAAPLYAVDPAEGEGGEEQVRLIPPVRLIDEAITELELKPDQKQQYQEIFKQHAPEITKHFQQQQQIYTPEQKTKRKEVVKKGREDGLSGQKLQQYVQQQVPLTPQQQKQFTQCQTEIKKCQTKFHQEVTKILTPQQQELLPPIGGKKGKGKGKTPNKPNKPNRPNKPAPLKTQ